MLKSASYIYRGEPLMKPAKGPMFTSEAGQIAFNTRPPIYADQPQRKSVKGPMFSNEAVKFASETRPTICACEPPEEAGEGEGQAQGARAQGRRGEQAGREGEGQGQGARRPPACARQGRVSVLLTHVRKTVSKSETPDDHPVGQF